MNIFTLLLLTTIIVNQAQSKTTHEQQMTREEAILEVTLETKANSGQQFSELVKSTIKLMCPRKAKSIHKNH